MGSADRNDKQVDGAQAGSVKRRALVEGARGCFNASRIGGCPGCVHEPQDGEETRKLRAKLRECSKGKRATNRKEALDDG